MRSFVDGKGIPSSVCSLSNQAAPYESSSRPFDAWSMVIASAANTDGCRYVMPVTSRPSRAFVVMPLSAASVVFPSKHSPGPSPYIGWKWSKPQMPSKPSSSAKRALDASSAHGIRCCAMSSPNFMDRLLSRLALRGHEAAEVVGRERLDDGVDRGARCRGAPDPEEWRELAEVPTRAHALHQLLAAARALAHQMDLAFLDHVRDVTVVALREEHG